MIKSPIPESEPERRIIYPAKPEPEPILIDPIFMPMPEKSMKPAPEPEVLIDPVFRPFPERSIPRALPEPESPTVLLEPVFIKEPKPETSYTSVPKPETNIPVQPNQFKSNFQPVPMNSVINNGNQNQRLFGSGRRFRLPKSSSIDNLFQGKK